MTSVRNRDLPSMTASTSCGPSAVETASPMPFALASTMAMVRSPPDPRAMRTCSPMMPIMRAGPRTVPMTNAFVRTISVNSRRITAIVLDMLHLLRGVEPGGGLGTDSLDEDLLEGRHDALEAAHPDSPPDEVLEEVLRVGVPAQHHGEVAPLLTHLGDEGRCAQASDGLVAPLLERDRDVRTAVRVAHLRHGAVDHLLASRQDADVVADPFRLLDHVRAEDDRPALPLQLEDDLL